MKESKYIKVEIGKLIKITPGKFHGWFESNIGPLRKPLSILLKKGGE